MQGAIGEAIVAGYFEYVKQCDFIQKNLKVSNGEMDVCGIDLSNKTIYVAEVAIHLETGLAYTRNGKRVNTERIIEKFQKDISYIRERFPDYQHKFSFWSPIVRDKKRFTLQLSQLEEVIDAQCIIRENFNIEIELIINQEFLNRLKELKEVAGNIKAAIEDNPIVRFIQLEEKLKRHLQ